MTLDAIAPGKGGKVTEVGGVGALRLRLLDMGITPGVEIAVVKTAPMGDPIQIRVRGYELTLRKEDAALIGVQEEQK